ncbi:MAG: hypothetical protein ABSA46_15195 [Thermodesulfovibrionales bacterium]
MDWIKQLFDSFDKLTDILNVGRLIFYTAAGFLVFYPIVMILRILSLSESQFTTFLGNFKDTASTDIPMILCGSLVVGFLIAPTGFVLFLRPLGIKLNREIQELDLAKLNISYRYPQMKNLECEDYHAWLMAEYFRFAEIVTFIPLGFLCGLPLLFVYTVIYLFRYSVACPFAGCGEGCAFLLILSIIIGISWFHVWPKFWLPKVVEETYRAYFESKKFLIAGVEDFKDWPKAKGEPGSPKKPSQ